MVRRINDKFLNRVFIFLIDVNCNVNIDRNFVFLILYFIKFSNKNM